MPRIENVVTLGEIARRLGEQEHRVKHVILTRKIELISRIGIIRLFAAEVVDVVHAELAGIDAKRVSGDARGTEDLQFVRRHERGLAEDGVA